jgi:hypothetical protein
MSDAPRLRAFGTIDGAAPAAKPGKAAPRKIAALRATAATIHFHPKGETKEMRVAARAAKKAAAEAAVAEAAARAVAPAPREPILLTPPIRRAEAPAPAAPPAAKPPKRK